MGGDDCMSELCNECGQRVPDMDRLVDHLTDEHDAFSHMTEGRPIDR